MKWKKIILSNCQSIKYAEYELSSNLTIVEAPSETGKSIYIKMLRLLCNWNSISKEERLSIIRRDIKGDYIENCASMRIVLENEQSCLFYVYKQDLLDWRLLDESDNIIKNGFGEVPELVRNFLGIKKIESFNRVISIIDNEEKIAYDSTDPVQNSELVKMYTTHVELENRLKNAEEALKELQNKKTNVRKQIDYLEEDLRLNYGNFNLDFLENRISYLKETNNKLNIFYNLKNILLNIANKKMPNVIEFNSLEERIVNLKNKKNIILALLPLYSLNHKVPNIIQVNDLENINTTFNNLSVQEKILNNFLILRKCLNDLINKKIIVEDLNFLNLKFINNISLFLNNLSVELNRKNNLNIVEEPKLNLDNLMQIINILFYLYTEMSNKIDINIIGENILLENLNTLTIKRKLLFSLNTLRYKLKTLEDLDLTKTEIDYLYSEYLRNNPTCPTCGQLLQSEIGECCI